MQTDILTKIKDEYEYDVCCRKVHCGMMTRRLLGGSSLHMQCWAWTEACHLGGARALGAALPC